MSYGFHAYAVDLGIFRHVFRARDDKLILSIEERSPHVREPAARQALVDLIYWNPLDPHRGSEYARAFECLCDHFGDFLPNDAWLPVSTSWLQAVDEALLQAGVPARVFTIYKLWGRGCPFKLPKPADFPGIGFLRAAELKPVSQALAAGDYKALRGKAQDKAQLKRSIEQVQGWVHTCMQDQTDLVCFFG